MSADNGALGLFAVGDANPIVSGVAGRMLSILSESWKATTDIINGNGTHGSLEEYDNRIRAGDITVGGSFSLNPVTADLAYLLPKILGTAGSAGTYALSDVLLPFVIQKRLRSSGSNVYTYPTNYVSRATFSASSGQPLLLAIDGMGLTEATPGSSWPSLAVPTDTDMLVFSDLVITLAGTTYSIKDFSLTIDNGLIPQRLNSRTATAMIKSNRTITLSHTLPEADITYTDFTDVAVAAVLTFTYNSQSLVFTMPAVRYTNETPVIAGRGGEDLFPLNGVARRTAGSASLVTTLDSTP